MKKFLRVGFLFMLVSAIAFVSCKDEHKAGNPNPITKVTVADDPDAWADIFPEKKEIRVHYPRFHDLTRVNLTFHLVEGASMYAPYGITTATMDLSDAEVGDAVVVSTGDDKVYYNVYAALDCGVTAIRGVESGIQAVGNINQQTGNVALNFSDAADLSKVEVHFTLGTDAELIQPTDTVAVLDLRQPYTVKAKSVLGGDFTYTIRAKVDLKFTIPDGWVKVEDRDIPPYMQLYKATQLRNSTAYALLATKKARFSVMSNGFDNLTQIPQFYAQAGPSAMAIINGSATENLAVVNGQVVVEDTRTDGKVTVGSISRTDPSTNMEADSLLFGDYKEIEGEMTIDNYALDYGLFCTRQTVKDGAAVKVDGETGLDARASIGYNKNRGDFVFVVVEKWENSQGISINDLADVMVLFGCTEAANLQGGSGSCLYVAGEPTIHSTKADVSEGVWFYKDIACCAVLK